LGWFIKIPIGLTFDIIISKLAAAAQKPKTFELSVIIREMTDPKALSFAPGSKAKNKADENYCEGGPCRIG
jgi:hypothetical protein